MSTTRLDNAPDDPRAGLLCNLVGELGTPFGYERSFRISRDTLLCRRFLLSIARANLGSLPLRKFAQLCRRMEMPEERLLAAARDFDLVQYVHLGYEAGETSCLYKVYLEHGIPAGEPASSTPILLHRATKWDPAAPARHALTHYSWYPSLTVPAMLDRMSRITRHGESFDIARGILLRAAERISRGGVRYLEVTEEQNPRRSFDLNLYDAGLTLEELAPFLERIRLHYSIPEEDYRSLLAPNGSRMVGHLAGGIHRGGEDFLTVYYGVEERSNAATEANTGPPREA
jgi:hypothetical protein